jgi:hypothetical protein
MMPNPELTGPYLMNETDTRDLVGKVIADIERHPKEIILKFTDGTSIEIKTMHSALSSLQVMVYRLRPSK